MTTHVDPQEALRLINEGALLIDVREPDEHARERIPNSRLLPLSRLSTPLDRTPAQQASWLPLPPCRMLPVPLRRT